MIRCVTVLGGGGGGGIISSGGISISIDGGVIVLSGIMCP